MYNAYLSSSIYQFKMNVDYLSYLTHFCTNPTSCVLSSRFYSSLHKCFGLVVSRVKADIAVNS